MAQVAILGGRGQGLLDRGHRPHRVVAPRQIHQPVEVEALVHQPGGGVEVGFEAGELAAAHRLGPLPEHHVVTGGKVGSRQALASPFVTDDDEAAASGRAQALEESNQLRHGVVALDEVNDPHREARDPFSTHRSKRKLMLA